MATFEIYRKSTIGLCMTEALDEMVQSGKLNHEDAYRVLIQFDESIAKAFKTQVKSKVTFKGHLHTYRFCDNVWIFVLRNAVFENKEYREVVSQVKIVACDAKLLLP